MRSKCTRQLACAPKIDRATLDQRWRFCTLEAEQNGTKQRRHYDPRNDSRRSPGEQTGTLRADERDDEPLENIHCVVAFGSKP